MSATSRREEAQAAAAALRAKQAKSAARERTIWIAALVVGLIAVGVAVAIIFTQGSNASGGLGGDQKNPAAAGPRGGFAFDASGVLAPDQDDPTWPQSLASDGGPVVVSVYFDFMCPWCGRFEQTQSATLHELLASGDIVLDSHPVAILDDYSVGTGYSTRAAGAAYAVAEVDPEHYLAFIEAMLAADTQPTENTAGLSDEEIAAIATGVGVSEAALEAIEAGSYLDYAAKATELASEDLGRVMTPTILLNGKNLTEELGVNWTEEGALAAAVAAAKG